jgi:hypothetical protein
MCADKNLVSVFSFSPLETAASGKLQVAGKNVPLAT